MNSAVDVEASAESSRRARVSASLTARMSAYRASFIVLSIPSRRFRSVTATSSASYDVRLPIVEKRERQLRSEDDANGRGVDASRVITNEWRRRRYTRVRAVGDDLKIVHVAAVDEIDHLRDDVLQSRRRRRGSEEILPASPPVRRRCR